MKKYSLILATILMIGAPQGMIAQAGDGFFSDFWGKIKTYMPRSHNNVNYSKTATMGVRGAETTESALTPYWKEDLSHDANFKESLQAYDHARDLCESGKFDNGVREFEALNEKDNNDLIKANVMLALGVCYGEKGDKAQSSKHFKSFVAAYPDHPMAKEVNQLIQPK